MINKIANLLIKIILRADTNLILILYNRLTNEYWTSVYLNYRKIYDISPSFKFNGIDIMFYGKGKIICGSNSYIGNYSTIQASSKQQVIIGNNCSISHNVRIYTESNNAEQNMNANNPKHKQYGDVIIEDGVWIGANVFIKEGVHIGKNVIIGANSVVVKDLEENGIYSGVPAKLIRYKNYDK